MSSAVRLYKQLCSFSNRVSYSDRLTCCDARCLTRCHLASVSDSCHFFRTSQTCTCDGYTSCSYRRAHACSSGTVFVTVTVDRGRCATSSTVDVVTRGPLSEADLDRGKTWSQSTPMRSYASPALYCQR